jgi:hypothetical protein
VKQRNIVKNVGLGYHFRINIFFLLIRNSSLEGTKIKEVFVKDTRVFVTVDNHLCYTYTSCDVSESIKTAFYFENADLLMGIHDILSLVPNMKFQYLW